MTPQKKNFRRVRGGIKLGDGTVASREASGAHDGGGRVGGGRVDRFRAALRPAPPRAHDGADPGGRPTPSANRAAGAAPRPRGRSRGRGRLERDAERLLRPPPSAWTKCAAKRRRVLLRRDPSASGPAKRPSAGVRAAQRARGARRRRGRSRVARSRGGQRTRTPRAAPVDERERGCRLRATGRRARRARALRPRRRRRARRRAAAVRLSRLSRARPHPRERRAALSAWTRVPVARARGRATRRLPRPVRDAAARPTVPGAGVAAERRRRRRRRDWRHGPFFRRSGQ